ncbi:hypothetical protein B0J13DRAFT_628291 [Dactylonectria estremocensis]|uniref:HAT C-terminal dimerisation domain-containing protein n=1 Tax=Dactylonectria estremocensis TaxID=1079267 RepID=A0A9P9DS96_9HYPO|nr:hypothetical protein B0J13DRAFT_628291 [Dactylonectria estremocensis]
MAADCERAFSSGKLALTNQRLAMSPAVLEEIELLKNWIKNKAVLLTAGDFGKSWAYDEASDEAGDDGHL